ncbi:TAXI family TRAP transporter solute-binding subunit [Aeromonas rivuli]|uniref:TAXI family TRAP transporter solute-binding subunit n=1 Tax=Aeromonas rivuli TaxID=648794 RepID=UPI0006949715|nr:TAXI family TRAP transporter solute-binding subunit [Aeromonas rivuli]
MRPRISTLLAPLFALLCWGTNAQAADSYLTISTGALTGVYYPVGGALCRLFNEDSAHNNLHCSVQSTKGSLANLRDLASGKSQLALVQSDVLYHAVHGTGPFEQQGPDASLRTLYRLHRESVALLVSEKSSISSLGDLVGKRVDLGSANGGDRITIMALIEAMGWQSKDFGTVAEQGPNRLQGLCDGTLDAAFVVAGQPSQVISDLTGRCKARLVAIEDAKIDQLIEGSTYYEQGRIAANLYPGQTLSLPTIAVYADLVALDTLPAETVHQLRRVMDARLKQFTRLHPALIALTQESMMAPTLAPPHAAMLDDANAPPARDATPPSLMPASLQPELSSSSADATTLVSGAVSTESTPTEAEHAVEGAAEEAAPEAMATGTVPAPAETDRPASAASNTVPAGQEPAVSDAVQPSAAQPAP